jgi:hypothetical protein
MINAHKHHSMNPFLDSDLQIILKLPSAGVLSNVKGDDGIASRGRHKC